MKLLANKKIKSLFCRLMLSMGLFVILSSVILFFKTGRAALLILTCALCMGLAMLAAVYGYFREQNQIMERAVAQIQAYISGNEEARIACDDEGELYRLFHEVISLVSILNAHADNERSAKKFLKNAISDISHQLKTPLAALNIYNGLIQEEAADSPNIREFAALSEQELDRIGTLVQNLLKITKFDAGTVVLEKTEENVADLLSCMKRHFSYRAEREGKTLLLSGDSDVTLLCDRSWLTEAVSNLVKNAFDHTKRGDTVRIEWRQFASMVQITVKDNGSGIHPEDLHHIFKRFYRSRFSKDTQGLGLGLPLTKSIVEAHGGTIELDSEPGAGSTFTINFRIPTKL